jgi:hypothetical protein
MEILFKKSFLTSSLLTIGLLLTACGQDIQLGELQDKVNQVAETAEKINDKVQQTNGQVEKSAEILQSGSALLVLRDVADMHLESNEHLVQLKETKAALETALNHQDAVALTALTQQLDTQLQSFNQELETLNLKSEEVDQIRQNILKTNESLLESPLLNNQIDFNKMDLSVLETQLGSINTEVLKLATMLVEKNESDDANS